MIKHIVMFQLKEEVNNKDKNQLLQEALDLLSTMEESIPSLLKLQVKTNTKKAPENNYDLALICDFDSMEGLEEYLVHPVHQAFGEYITKVRENRACIDIEED